MQFTLCEPSWACEPYSFWGMEVVPFLMLVAFLLLPVGLPFLFWLRSGPRNARDFQLVTPLAPAGLLRRILSRLSWLPAAALFLPPGLLVLSATYAPEATTPFREMIELSADATDRAAILAAIAATLIVFFTWRSRDAHARGDTFGLTR